MFFVLGGTGFLMPFYLETVAGYSTDKVGMLMAISPLLGGLAAPLGGTLADRLGARLVTVAGVTLVALGCFSFATAGVDVSIWGFALRVAPIGVGMGLFNAANNSGVLNAVPSERLSIASALLSLMRTLGQTTGVPVIASIFALSALTRAGGHTHTPLLTLPPQMLVHGVHVAFVAAAAIALCAAVLGTGQYARRRSVGPH
jgi:MFS family permease